ncbi:hypothetical protein BCAH1134_C0411 (plasmid) [Bacillus cereus AH1134]|nr:hypothetical protein BCAH1134_C0411 [Bacillus cereus AH1134]
MDKQTKKLFFLKCETSVNNYHQKTEKITYTTGSFFCF